MDVPPTVTITAVGWLYPFSRQNRYSIAKFSPLDKAWAGHQGEKMFAIASAMVERAGTPEGCRARIALISSS